MQNLTTTKQTMKAILKRYCFCTQMVYISGLSVQPYQMVGGLKGAELRAAKVKAATHFSTKLCHL